MAVHREPTVEVTVLGTVDIDLQSDAAAQGEDRLDSGDVAGKEGPCDAKDSVGSSGQFFWYYSFGLNFIVFLANIILNFALYYCVIWVELDGGHVQAARYLRGLPWAPMLWCSGISGAVIMATNVLPEDAPWPWRSMLAIALIGTVNQVALMAIPNMGFILAGIIWVSGLALMLASQDFVLNRRLGRPFQDFKKLAKSTMLYSTAVEIADALGALALVLYAEFGNMLPVASEIILMLSLAGTEKLSLTTALLGAKRSPEFAPPRMLSVAILICAASIESFRLSCMLSGVMRNPQSRGYITLMASSFLANVSFRTGWTNHALKRFTNRSMFVPTIGSLILREVKLVSGYGRLAFPVGIMLARLCHNIEQPWYFNESVVLVLSFVFVMMLAEDFWVWWMIHLGWVPKMSALDRDFYSSCPDGSLSKAYSCAGDGQAVRTFSLRSPPWKLEFLMQLFVQVSASYMAMWGIAPLVSVQYLIGFRGVTETTATDGAFIWL